MSKNFQELLDTLNGVSTEADELHKSVAASEAGAADEGATDDDAIQAAAAEAGAAGDGGDAGDAGDGGEGGEGEELGKSFEFVDAAGNKHEAVDATELVKSLMQRQEATDETLAKAMTAMTNVVQKQGELIKSLTAQVNAMGNQGRGRKTLVTVAEKPDAGTLAKGGAGDKPGVTSEEFFAKANAAFDAGKISGKDLNVISVCLRGNHPIDPSLIQKVAQA